jgi:zinc protease
VHFPHAERRDLSNGLRIWSMSHTAVPVVSIVLLLDAGSAADPADVPGLASMTSALMTEGAADRDAIALSDALARIGSSIDADTGPDVSTLSMTTPAKHLQTAMELIADVARRPRLLDADFERVRELRLSRLKQLRLSPAASADRALLAAVFGAHPYGHGSLGTTRSVGALSLSAVQKFWSDVWSPSRATLIICGDVEPRDAHAVADKMFADWSRAGGTEDGAAIPAVVDSKASTVFAIDRPAATQSELRAGQTSPGRRTQHYHSLVALNAIVGGQFTSRINRNLRESRAITYGARTSLDLRRQGGLFACDTSVQSDATAIAASEIIREFRGVMDAGAINQAELTQAQASLTRGYVRQFETPLQLARAMVTLAAYRLPDDTFDRFVPGITGLGPENLTEAACAVLRPDDCCIVIVGDLEKQRESLASLGRPVVEISPEF